MKKSNIIALSAGLVALVAVVGIAISTFAQEATSDTNALLGGPYHMRFWDDLSDSAQTEIQSLWETRQAERQARQEKIDAAFEQGYDAWVAAITEEQGEDAPILDQVTAENFDQFRQAHDYMESARENMDNANAIYDELGIKRGFGKRGIHHGMRGFDKDFGPMMGGFAEPLVQ